VRKGKAKFQQYMRDYTANHIRKGKHHKPTNIKMSSNFKKFRKAAGDCGIKMRQVDDHTLELVLSEEESVFFKFNRTNAQIVETQHERRGKIPPRDVD
jgi:hypothetical protein